jgi:hypothetical protein
MTDEMMSLQALLEKSPDTDQLREMIGFAAHRLMELEVESLTGATHGNAPPIDHPPQRVSRPRLGNPRRNGGVAHPEAAQGQLLSGLSRAAPDGREGADGGDPGSLHPGRVDPLGRRTGPCHGHDRHLQEPGFTAVRRDRRQDRGLPRPPPGGRVALCLAGRDLCEGAPRRPRRKPGSDGIPASCSTSPRHHAPGSMPSRASFQG